jgi:hypothetical protein
MRGNDGENNMGKLTMKIVDFMSNECGWSLTVCNGTNLGFYGEVREQQIKFKAPHPLNLIAPHIMIELRMAGFIEVNGANTGSIHETLQEWMESSWKAQRMQNDPNFCDVNFRCSVFKRRGTEGENNMGLCTMQLVDFMTLKCGWTLITCNGGNFGKFGDIREQQLVFRNDAHVQHGEDHIMVELRDVHSRWSSGYIEVNGIESSPSIAEPLDGFFKSTWNCKDYVAPSGQKAFCDKKYCTPKGFYYREPDLTNNLGLRTIELAEFMSKRGWNLLLCNGGYITEMRSYSNRARARSISFTVGKEFEGHIHREQQIKFTKAKAGEKSDESLLMIELRAVPQDPELESIPFCIGPRWCHHCSSATCLGADDHRLDRKGWRWSLQTSDRRRTRREEVRHWLNGDNLSPQLCQWKGSMDAKECRYPPYENPWWRTRVTEEEKKKLEKASHAYADNPTSIERRVIPQTVARAGTVPCAIIKGVIEVNGRNTDGVYEELERFVQDHLKGHRIHGSHPFCDVLYNFDALRMKRTTFPTTNPEIDGYYLGENNLGVYTMRLCDFLVDHLGDWELIVCNGNALERAWKVDRDRAVSITAREQQLVFRHRPGRRNVFMAKKIDCAPLGRRPLDAPAYWKFASLEGTIGQELVTVGEEELAWMQVLLDSSYRKAATKDRKQEMADRFVAVAALRSEYPALWDGYAARRKDVSGMCRDPSGFVVPRTMSAVPQLTERCSDLENGNTANEAYLLHGTSPTSALAILSTSFKIDFAGGAAGMMFGPGIYMAESSSKADEYAQDDAEGAYKGLFAMLVCRTVVGAPFVVQEPGSYKKNVLSGSYDCVLGDREKAAGTYREFTFFHEDAVYPEYVVFYRRSFDAKVQPTQYGAGMAAAPAQQSMMDAGSVSI